MRIDVKICGLKSEAAMAAALDCGASHVGFIFFERSPRHVTPGRAAELRRAARGRARAVAVTVDAGDPVLDAIVETVAPDMLQLHGDETPERVREVRQRYGLPVMKALSIREAADLEAVGDYLGIADRLLFDAKAPKDAAVPGGRGVAFDWTLLANLDPAIDYMLSGGLNAGNIAAALSVAKPKGVDVSSGVEPTPGDKSPELIAGFFAALRAATDDRPAGMEPAQGKGFR
jgi:phosphoribosylanthranilate isomerase